MWIRASILVINSIVLFIKPALQHLLGAVRSRVCLSDYLPAWDANSAAEKRGVKTHSLTKGMMFQQRIQEKEIAG